MAIRLPYIANAKQLLRWSSLNEKHIPKGYFAVYVGEIGKRRFTVPISYLNQPSFQKLLIQAAEEYGFEHPTGGLTIPCREDDFIDLISRWG